MNKDTFQKICKVRDYLILHDYQFIEACTGMFNIYADDRLVIQYRADTEMLVVYTLGVQDKGFDRLQWYLATAIKKVPQRAKRLAIERYAHDTQDIPLAVQAAVMGLISKVPTANAGGYQITVKPITKEPTARGTYLVQATIDYMEDDINE